MGSVSVAWGLVLATAGALVEPTVEVPLSQWTQLQARDDAPAITVVEEARLTGSLKRGDLRLLLAGRATRRLPTVDVFELSGALLFGCEGDALVSRNGTRYRLTPTATRFSVRCRLAPEWSDGIRLSAADAVLRLDAAVEGGELFSTSVGAWEIVRSVPSEDLVPVLASGRYRLLLEHEVVRFHYEIEARNPNRTRQSLVLRFAAGERVSWIDTAARWEPEDGAYRFQLLPGTTSITLTGTLLGASWTPPLEAPRQYVLFESHPLLLPTLIAEAARVSPTETGFKNASRGAQALLIDGGESVSWTVSAKETLRTTSFAVNAARHVFYVGATGEVVGNSEYAVANQGAPGLSLPMSATPTYAGIDGQPTFLTRNDSGDLRLPLGFGTQTVEVQHRQRVQKLPGFVLASLSTPRIEAPATRSFVELRFPGEWVPLVAGVGGTQRFHYGSLPPTLFLFLAIWTERVLAALGMSRRRWVLAGVLGLAAALVGVVLVVVVAALLAVTALWLWPRFLRRALGTKIVLAGSALLVAWIALSIAGSDVRHLFGSSTAAMAGETAVSKASSRKTLRNFAAGSEDVSSDPDGEVPDAYQGLPARIELPWGAETLSFSEEMSPAGQVVTARMLLVSRTVVAWLSGGIALLASLLLARRRHELREGWMRLLSAAGFGKTDAMPQIDPSGP